VDREEEHKNLLRSRRAWRRREGSADFLSTVSRLLSRKVIGAAKAKLGVARIEITVPDENLINMEQGKW